jgi:hypothetical protein
MRAVRRRPTPRIELALPTLEPGEARRWEQRLNRLLNGCGCDEGAVGLLGGLAVSLAMTLLGWPYPLSLAAAISAVASAAVGGAVAGKLTGQQRGRRRARREALELIARLAGPPSTVPFRRQAVAS